MTVISQRTVALSSSEEASRYQVIPTTVHYKPLLVLGCREPVGLNLQKKNSMGFQRYDITRSIFRISAQTPIKVFKPFSHKKFWSIEGIFLALNHLSYMVYYLQIHNKAL